VPQEEMSCPKIGLHLKSVKHEKKCVFVRYDFGKGFMPISICAVALKFILLFSVTMLYVCIVKFKFQDAKL